MSTQRGELAQIVANTRVKIWGVNEDELCEYDYDLADAILAAYTLKPRVIATVEELDTLPVGSVVLARWDDGRPDYQMTRCASGGASSSGFGVASGKHWTVMANWGATLTVLHVPGVAQ